MQYYAESFGLLNVKKNPISFCHREIFSRLYRTCKQYWKGADLKIALRRQNATWSYHVSFAKYLNSVSLGYRSGSGHTQSFRYVLVIYCWVTSYHAFSGLKQHAFIAWWFLSVRRADTAWVKSRCQLGTVLASSKLTVCWQNSCPVEVVSFPSSEWWVFPLKTQVE